MQFGVDLKTELLDLGFAEDAINRSLLQTADKETAVMLIITEMEREQERMNAIGSGSPLLVALVRSDLQMGLGKIAAQVGHAVLQTFIHHQGTPFLAEWREHKQPIRAYKVKDRDEMLESLAKLEPNRENHITIHDRGRTQVPAGSLTVAAVLVREGSPHLKSLSEIV